MPRQYSISRGFPPAALSLALVFAAQSAFAQSPPARRGLRFARLILIVLAALLLLASSRALAQSPAVQRGLTFVRVHCAQCHAIDKVSESPLAIAPPFRTLHLKYPIESLERPLAEGSMTGHPTMPQFRLEPDQIRDVIAYLKTLEQ